MKMSEAFPSNWLKASDLQGHTIKVQIKDVVLEDVGDGEKPILTFIGKDKGLVLNKTNANMIVDAYGDDTDNWTGKDLEIFPDKTSFKGQIVSCIRVRTPAPPPSAVADEDAPF
jgi:hypothetical protein